VIKLEPLAGTYQTLEHEFLVYKKLSRGIGIPGVHWFGTEAGFNMMVMDHLGQSLNNLSPASRVESHDSVVWLQTGVSSGNWPTNVLKSRKYRVHCLKARMLGVSGTPVSDAMGKLRDLGDRLSDKIRTLICLDWDPDSMFPFWDGLWCHHVSDLCYSLVLYISALVLRSWLWTPTDYLFLYLIYLPFT